MGTLKEEAENYEPTEKLNIADLGYMEIDMDLKEVEGFNEKKNEHYTYKAYVNGNKEYYVSYAVLEQIKEILKLKSDAKKFKISKTGSGLQTKYKVEVLG